MTRVAAARALARVVEVRLKVPEPEVLPPGAPSAAARRRPGAHRSGHGLRRVHPVARTGQGRDERAEPRRVDPCEPSIGRATQRRVGRLERGSAVPGIASARRRIAAGVAVPRTMRGAPLDAPRGGHRDDPHCRWQPSDGRLAATRVACCAGCAAAQSSASATDAPCDAVGSPVRIGGRPSAGGTAALDPGVLERRHPLRHRRALASRSSLMPTGGSRSCHRAATQRLSREDVTVYFLAPATVLAPDGSAGGSPAPTPGNSSTPSTPAPIVDVLATEPFETNGSPGSARSSTRAGGGPRSALSHHGKRRIRADRRPDPMDRDRARWSAQSWFPSSVRTTPDIDAAWEVAGTLVDSLEAAP